MLAQDGHENENSPKSIDDAGNRRQQLSKKSQRTPQKLWTHFCQEDSYADRQGHRNDQSHYRGNQRAVDKRQRAEVAVDGVPSLLEEKLQAELVDGELRTSN